MSDYGYVADRVRKAFSAVARSERALARNPQSLAAQLNYASRKKLAEQSQEEMLRLAEINNIEVCHYKLLPDNSDSFPLEGVSKSCLNYQYLFSQVHDSVRNGKKSNASIGKEAAQESTLQVAYTYSGSLAIVLLVESEKTFFSGSLDATIDAFFDVISVKSRSDVNLISDRFGSSVVKRVRDWSASNSEAGFSIDLRWRRSDGRALGGVFEKSDFDRIVDLVGDESDDTRQIVKSVGVLVGIDLKSGNFHMSSDLTGDIRGSLNEEFNRSESVEVGINYLCTMVEFSKTKYATGVVNVRFELLRLDPAPL